MALIKCPECKTKVSDTADKCPKCGCVITKQTVKAIQDADGVAKGIGCLVVAVVLVGWGFYSWLSPEEPKAVTEPPPPVTEAQKAANAAWEKKYEQERTLLQDNLAKAPRTQLRGIFTKCLAMVQEAVQRDYKGPFEAVIVDETSPDSYQAAVAMTNGGYRSIEERLAMVLESKKRGSDHLEYSVDLKYTAIFIGESFSGTRMIPRSYRCSLKPDLSVSAAEEIR